MKRTLSVELVLAMVAAALSLCGCAETEPAETTRAELVGSTVVPGPAESPRPTGLEHVLYDCWNERIEVKGSDRSLHHTRTQYTYADPTSGNPTGSRSILVAQGTLTRADITALAAFVRECGFLDLKDQYGAPEGHRYYPYSLIVAFAGGKPQTVRYRSNPQFGPQPEAFRKLVEHLKKLSGTVAEQKP
jgi:hypothetical protein